MINKKKKLSRKEIKEDKLVETIYKTRSFYETHKNKIHIYAIVVVVVVLAGFWYISHKNSLNNEASVKLGLVMSLYDSGAYLEAIEGKQSATGSIMGLKQIVKEYGSTENGETAKIYLANAYENLGQTEEAFKYFEDYSGSIGMYKATALAGEASYYSVKKEYQKAGELYLKASKVEKNNVMNPDYMLQAGINFMKAGENEQAKSLLQTIKDDYKTSAAFAQVDRYLAQLN